jgi:thiamine-phosphate pyrophosphorylase
MLRYAITDGRSLVAKVGDRVDALVAQAGRLAARGDVDYLQLREKDLAPAQLASLARHILEVFQGAPFIRDRQGGDGWGDKSSRPKLLINSRADVAIAVGANGVHLTSSSGELTPAQVRELYSSARLPPPTVSLSCHTLAEVIAARGLRSEDELCFAPDPATAPDLILFGPVFEKILAGPAARSEMRIAEGSGLDLLRRACAAAVPIPVLALGGITDGNAAACLAAGATGIAAIRAFSNRSV